MRLLAKTTLVMLVTGALFFVFIFFVTGVFIRKSYTDIETIEGRRSVEIAENILRREHETLHVQTQDYAGWDDTYTYIADRNTDYESSNLVETMFKGLKLTFIAYLQNDGEVVFTRWYDFESESFVPVPKDLLDRLKRRDAFAYHTTEESSVQGIIQTSNGPLLIASEPILTSEKKGPIRGTLIMGRLIDATRIATISRIAGHELNLIPLDGGVDALFHERDVNPADCPCVIRKDEDTLVTYAVLKDIDGVAQGLLRVTEGRRAYEIGQLSIATTLGTLASAIALFTVLMILILRWQVLLPIARLAYAVNNAARTGTVVDDRVFSAENGSEISDLGRRFLEAFTSLREQREESERQRVRLQAVLDASVEGIVVLNSQGEISLVNESFAHMSGVSMAKLQGKRFGTQVSFADEKTMKTAGHLIDRVFRTGKAISSTAGGTLVLVGKRETPLPVTVSIAPLLRENKKVRGCVLLVHDATVDREIERGKTDFVSVASHQLRTPLASIKWGLELLEGGSDMKRREYDEHLAETRQVADRMVLLVNELLRVSRIDAGKQPPLVRKEQDVRGLMDRLMQEMQPLAKEAQVEVHYEVPPKALRVKVDETQLFQALSNVAQNAIKYSPKGGAIWVTLSGNKHDALFTVRDQGPGIPKHQAHRIFDRLFRADNVMSQYEGTGLGLYIAKNIVTQHGGKIWFESEEGKGATFYVAIPHAA